MYQSMKQQNKKKIHNFHQDLGESLYWNIPHNFKISKLKANFICDSKQASYFVFLWLLREELIGN